MGYEKIVTPPLITYLKVPNLLQILCYGKYVLISSIQFSHSVVSDYFDPKNCNTAGLPVYHQLLEFTQIHVH